MKFGQSHMLACSLTTENRYRPHHWHYNLQSVRQSLIQLQLVSNHKRQFSSIKMFYYSSFQRPLTIQQYKGSQITGQFSRKYDVIKYSCRFFLTYSAMLGLINGLHFNNLHLVCRIFKNSFLKMAKNKSRNTFAHLVKVLSNNCCLGELKILSIFSLQIFLLNIFRYIGVRSKD